MWFNTWKNVLMWPLFTRWKLAITLTPVWLECSIILNFKLLHSSWNHHYNHSGLFPAVSCHEIIPTNHQKRNTAHRKGTFPAEDLYCLSCPFGILENKASRMVIRQIFRFHSSVLDEATHISYSLRLSHGVSFQYKCWILLLFRDIVKRSIKRHLNPPLLTR